MASAFKDIIDFFADLGLFDVVLPFILVFTIVFAILEKTKVYGTYDFQGVTYTKKNLNAITSFVIAFLVIASSELVDVLTTVSSRAVVLMFLIILFLMLVGSFYKEGEPVALEGSWRTIFMLIMFVGIVGIFLDTLTTEDGRTWLERVGDFFDDAGDTDELIGSIILLGITVALIGYLTTESTPKADKTK